MSANTRKALLLPFCSLKTLGLVGFMVALGLIPLVHAAEPTAMEKLCAGYEAKKIMLEKRVKRGVHPWEKDKIKAQQDTLAADSAKHCGKPAAVVKPR